MSIERAGKTCKTRRFFCAPAAFLQEKLHTSPPGPVPISPVPAYGGANAPTSRRKRAQAQGRAAPGNRSKAPKEEGAAGRDRDVPAATPVLCVGGRQGVGERRAGEQQAPGGDSERRAGQRAPGGDSERRTGSGRSGRNAGSLCRRQAGETTNAGRGQQAPGGDSERRARTTSAGRGQQAPGGKGTAGEKERPFGLKEKALSDRA